MTLSTKNKHKHKVFKTRIKTQRIRITSPTYNRHKGLMAMEEKKESTSIMINGITVTFGYSLDEIERNPKHIEVSNKTFNEILAAINLDVDQTSILMDKDTNTPFRGERDKAIKVTKNQKPIMVAGSLHIASNTADYSQILAEKKQLKINVVEENGNSATNTP